MIELHYGDLVISCRHTDKVTLLSRPFQTPSRHDTAAGPHFCHITVVHCCNIRGNEAKKDPPSCVKLSSWPSQTFHATLILHRCSAALACNCDTPPAPFLACSCCCNMGRSSSRKGPLQPWPAWLIAPRASLSSTMTQSCPCCSPLWGQPMKR